MPIVPFAAQSALSLSLALTAGSPTVVNVDDGERLLPTDINAGEFMGQMFTLGPDTIFEINFGGALGFENFGSFIDYQGSTINLNNGAQLSNFNTLAGANLNIFSGAQVGSNLGISVNTSVMMFGGEVESTQIFNNGSLNMMDGDINRLDVTFGGVAEASGGFVFFTDLGGGTLRVSGTANLRSLSANGSEIEMSGGGIGIASGIHNTHLTLTGGFIGRDFDATGASVIDMSGGTFDRSLGFEDSSTLNLTGGTIGERFRPEGGTTVNISGGSILRDFEALGGEVNISGGEIGANVNFFSFAFRAGTNSNVDISGGRFGPVFVANNGSSVEFIGGEFSLNEAAISSIDQGLASFTTDIFTLTLEDGSVMILASEAGDFLAQSTTVLTEVELPKIETKPLTVSTGSGPNGLRPGQTLTISGDASLGNAFAAVDSTLNIEDGSVGVYFESLGATVNMSGGELGLSARLWRGSTLNLSGGAVGDDLTLTNATILNMTGGSIGDDFFLESGAEAHISGGTIGEQLNARPGSVVTVSGDALLERFVANGAEVTIDGGHIERFGAGQATAVSMSEGSIGPDSAIGTGTDMSMSGGSLGFSFSVENGGRLAMSGGTVAPRFEVSSLGEVVLIGDDFKLNSVPVADLPAGLLDGGTLTGVLEDGSVFLFSDFATDSLLPGTVTLTKGTVAPADLTPINLTTGVAPNGLRAGQSLTISGDAVIPSQFAAVESTLEILGGSAGADMELYETDANITGGFIDTGFRIYKGSDVLVAGDAEVRGLNTFDGAHATIAGGTVAGFVSANAGSSIAITGGTMTSLVRSFGDAELMISGGHFADIVRSQNSSSLVITGGTFLGSLTADQASTIDLSGGTIEIPVSIRSSSSLNVFAQSAIIDGIALDAEIGETIILDQLAIASIEFILADGSPFDLLLPDSAAGNGGVEFDFIAPTATLTVTLVPTPGTVTLLGVASLAATRRRSR